MEGVKTVSSTSFQNASSLQIEYSYGIDMDDAAKGVQEALDAVTKPEAVQDPSVAQISINAFPVIALSIANTEKDLEALTKGCRG